VSKPVVIAPRRWNVLSDILVVILIATISLAICSKAMDITRIYVNGLNGPMNDQVGYIAAARNLSRTGQLTSNIIYPAYIDSKYTKNYFYMPGFYYLSAAFYTLFGYSDLNAILPSIFSFLLASVCIFLIATKMYSKHIGLISVFLFAIFPANIIFSLSAMSEMAIVAASCLSFCIFIYLPKRMQIVATPFLLIIPFLFRETTALLVIPMALTIAQSKDGKNIRSAIFVFLASFVVLILIMRSDISAGRPSIQAVSLFDRRMMIYTDAKLVGQMHPTLWDYVLVVPKRMTIELSGLADLRDLPALSVYITVATIPLGIILAYRKRDWFALYIAIFLFVVLAVTSIYAFSGIIVVRMLLFVFPFTAIILACVYDQLVSLLDRLRPKHPTFSMVSKLGAIVILGILAQGGLQYAYRLLSDNKYISAFDNNNTEFLQSIKHDDATMLVSPYSISLDYVHRHYPVRWSFIPENSETLALLSAQYNIGTLMISINPETGISPDTSLKPDEIERFGLHLVDKVTYNGMTFLVFKKLIP
jgi:hypothetical protein